MLGPIMISPRGLDLVVFHEAPDTSLSTGGGYRQSHAAHLKNHSRQAIMGNNYLA
jgi:hypothetical protein